MGEPGLERYAGRKVGILGLARSGLAAARALRGVGAEVLAFDDSPEALAASGLPAGRPETVADLALLVPSPGVPLDHPLIRTARAAAVPVRGDVDLLAGLLGPRPLVGITGTNGKSTTTALIHHLLRAARRDAVMGGNIGLPVLDLDLGPPERVVVLELSSFQLDLCQRLRCKVAVWLNLTPDHLDRHGDLEGYIAAKRRIFEGQGPDDVAVVAIDDAPSRELACALRRQGRRVVTVSLDAAMPAEIEAGTGHLIDRLDGAPVETIDLKVLANLRGRHNWQNAAAAYAALRGLGLTPEAAVVGLPSFRALPHRMEEVARAGRVVWVNDSKATNTDAAATSLKSFADIFWIAGGKPKPGGFRSLRPLLGGVRAGYLIGQAAEEIAADLGDLAPMRRLGTLEAALAAASADARASDAAEAVVLLAPACASFDQFTSFEARGDRFRALAQLAAREPAA